MKKGISCYELLEHFKPTLCSDYTNRDFLLGSERGMTFFTYRSNS
jgi:hypothetical protein